MLSLLAKRALASGAVRQAACSATISLKQFSSTATAWSGAATTPVPVPANEDRQAGMWAERALPHLSPAELADFEEVLGLENPDLFKWLTGQLDPPAEMLDNKAYRLIAAHVDEMMAAKSQAAAQAVKGAEWKRGWDDWSSKELKKEGEKAK